MGEVLLAHAKHLGAISHAKVKTDRPRPWETRVGEIELAIPRKRSGEAYFPSFLEPRKRSEQAIVSVVMEAYVNGVSTRKVDRLVEQLGIGSMSKDRVSAICRGLDEQVAAFRERPLEGTYPYLWLDAKVLKVRDRGHVYPKALVIAYGVHESGRREVIGLDLGEVESGAFCQTQNPSRRGQQPVDQGVARLRGADRPLPAASPRRPPPAPARPGSTPASAMSAAARPLVTTSSSSSSSSYGAGGSTVGPGVAERLGVPLVDRAIPVTVAERLAAPLGQALAAEDRCAGPGRLLARFARLATLAGAGPLAAGRGAPREEDFRAQTEQLLWELAETTGGVVLGRGAAIPPSTTW